MKTLALLPFLIVAAGCTHSHYEVMLKTTPNPITPARRFVIEPLRMASLTVDRVPEGAWRASRTPYQNAEFDADERAVQQHFADRVMRDGTRAGLQFTGDREDPGAIIIRPILHGVTKGWFTFYYDMPTRADLTVQLIDSQGRLIDELRVGADAKGVTFTTRLERVADRLGSAVVRYLRKRQRE